jgi:hypothetical protein
VVGPFCAETVQEVPVLISRHYRKGVHTADPGTCLVDAASAILQKHTGILRPIRIQEEDGQTVGQHIRMGILGQQIFWAFYGLTLLPQKAGKAVDVHWLQHNAVLHMAAASPTELTVKGNALFAFYRFNFHVFIHWHLL